MIRLATIADAPFFYHLYMHPSINPYLLYEWMDAAAFAPIYQDLMEKGQLYVFSQAEMPVGMFKLVPLLHRTDHVAYLGGVGVHPDHMGKGIGKQMMHAIVDFARQRGFRRVELSTATINTKAIRLYEQVGFAPEGVMRQYTHLKSEGRFLDELLMAILL